MADALNSQHTPNLDWLVSAMAAHTITLHPLVRIHQLPHVPQIPEGIEFGWAQFPSVRGRGFSIVVFLDRWHCLPIAFADSQGRVFTDYRIDPDTQHLTPVMSFIQEGYIDVPQSRLYAHEPHDQDKIVPAVCGGIVFHNSRTGEPVWLASWLKSGKKYTLEQLRSPIPAHDRARLDYRDALTTAYIHAVLIAQHEGAVIGFGSGNIFRRLELEAPIGAIRRSLADITRLANKQYRVSGLERYFEQLMKQAGIWQTDTGLEAVHGAEPLQLLSSPHSGVLLFAWQEQLNLKSFFAAMRIEAAINRFAAVSRVVEYNARTGHWPIEDTMSIEDAARLDWALLENPALLAEPIDDTDRDALIDDLADEFNYFTDEIHNADMHADQAVPVDDILALNSAQSIQRLMHMTRLRAMALWRQYPDPLAPAQSKPEHTHQHQDADGSAWIYRQTLAHMLRSLNVPYRFDVEFRANLQAGNVAIGFTSVGSTLMPTQRLHDNGVWQELSEHERAILATQYNLRLGIIIACLAYAADTRVRSVSIHIDSLGLEELNTERASDIERIIAKALASFNAHANRGAGDAGVAEDMQGVHIDEQGVSIDPLSSTSQHHADPKDGDIHGDPAQLSSLLSPTAQPSSDTATASGSQQDITPDTASETQSEQQTAESDASAASIDGIVEAQGNQQAKPDQNVSDASHLDAADMESNFMEIMQGFSFDNPDFNQAADPNTQDDHSETANSEEQNSDMPARDGNDTHSLHALQQQPQLRTLVTVTFDRDMLMQAVNEDGFADPIALYQHAGADMRIAEDGSLAAVSGTFTLQDSAFAPTGSQEIPELSEWQFDSAERRIFAAHDALDMSIQRDDVLQHMNAQMQRLHDDQSLDSVHKARQAMQYIDRVADPELQAAASNITSAFIDGTAVPQIPLTLSNQLRDARIALRGMQGGSFEQNLEQLRAVVANIDAQFAAGLGVARYFNSYAERIVYNHMFATSHEQTVLIPDHLFMAHMDLVDIAAQLAPMQVDIDPLAHLNTLVSYAPAYPLVHMRLAMYLSHQDDWDSSRAACLNALRVALDRNDAAFAYYRLAYCSWMRDEFAIAAACYEMCEHINGYDNMAQVTLQEEFAELMRRTHSQRIAVPHTIEEAQAVLRESSIPIWPHTQAAQIVRDAARVSVDHAMFVPARTLCLAAARMSDSRRDMDTVDIQFLRSLRP